MATQLLECPTSPRARSRIARHPGDTPVAPHRTTHRNLGPVQSRWSAACAPLPPAADPTELLHWTPRAIGVAVVLVTLLGIVMLITLVAAFLGVSPEPLEGASQILLSASRA